MAGIRSFPVVGDTLVRENGPDFELTWTVTKISVHGRMATVREPDLGSRQVFRNRIGTWRLEGITVRFRSPEPVAAVSDGALVIFEGDVNAGEAPFQPTYETAVLETADTTPAPAQTALDLVKPLVDAAVKLYRESLEIRAQVVERKVDPNKSPQVAQAVQRFMGACEILAAMWRAMGLSDRDMTLDRARRAVQTQYAADQKALLAAVRQHAQDNYDQGWDCIVEAYEDQELLKAIGDARTPEAAIERIRQIVEVTSDVRQDRLPLAGWDY